MLKNIIKCFKRTVNWNRYQIEITNQTQNQYLDFLIDPNFPKTYGNIREIATGQGDDYTTACSLDYPSFKKHYKLTATD